MKNSYRELNETGREIVLKTVQDQEKFLKQFQDTLPALISNSRSDPQQVNKRLASSIASLANERQHIISALDDMDSSFAEAQKK